MIAGLVVLVLAGVGSGLFLLVNAGGRGAPVATVGNEGFSPAPVEASAALPAQPLAGGEATAPEPQAPAPTQALVPPAQTPAAAAPAPPVGATQAPVAPPVVPAARPEPAPGTAAESAGSAAPVGPWAWVVAGNYANVRSSGNSAAPILGTIAPGDSLQIEVSGRTWRQVRKGSLTGWVWVEALNLPGNR